MGEATKPTSVSLLQDFGGSDIQSGHGGSGGRGGDISSHNIVGSTITTTHSYNITVFLGSTTQSHKDLTEQWEATIAKVQAIAENKTDDEPEVDESKEGSESEDKPPTIRLLSIYTGVDKAAKKLKRSTDVVLTLTPAVSDPNNPWSTIVWKVLRFEKTTTMHVQVAWSDKAGFCVLTEDDSGTLTPGDLKKQVEPGYVAILKSVDESHDFDEEVRMSSETNSIAVCNTTISRQRFALCTIDPLKPETDQFSPVVDLDPFAGSTGKNGFQCGPPVMLQAYAVPGYRERQPINTATLRRQLFSNPIDISKLGQDKTFRLYSNNAGKFVLEE